MPRAIRNAKAGYVYHVLNRANARIQIFQKPGDYYAFEQIIQQANDRIPMRLLSYCIMPNHWHLVLWPRGDDDLSEYMRWLTLTHTQRWHKAHDTVGGGHLYQGRFKSFPVQTDSHYLTVCRYVEQNPLKARLVRQAQIWRWCSLYRRLNPSLEPEIKLHKGPLDLPPPQSWLSLVNKSLKTTDTDDIHVSIERNRPFGHTNWTNRIAGILGLESTLRPRGRPKKQKST
ncbi:MAG: transposase [Sedimentisphaerales bacterium]|nr:transposase [Sedimentisphaerales bacterium]